MEGGVLHYWVVAAVISVLFLREVGVVAAVGAVMSVALALALSQDSFSFTLICFLVFSLVPLSVWLQVRLFQVTLEFDRSANSLSLAGSLCALLLLFSSPQFTALLIELSQLAERSAPLGAAAFKMFGAAITFAALGFLVVASVVIAFELPVRWWLHRNQRQMSQLLYGLRLPLVLLVAGGSASLLGGLWERFLVSVATGQW